MRIDYQKSPQYTLNLLTAGMRKNLPVQYVKKSDLIHSSIMTALGLRVQPMNATLYPNYRKGVNNETKNQNVFFS